MHTWVQKKTLRRHTIAGMATLGIAALVLTGCGSDNGDDDAQGPPHQTFVSRPDLQPVELQLTEGEAWSAEYAESDEYVFLTTEFDTATPASAALIVDATGELVWMDPVKQHINDHGYFDLRVQEYRGEPVLTYFKGPAALGWGYGDIYLMDSNYHVITSVTTSGSLPAHETDFHDAVITEDDTMLVMAYVATQTDLSEVGGEEDGWVHDGVVQEVDIETGEVLFEWSALDHVPVTHAMNDLEGDEGSRAEPFDYFHINSATLDDDGNILISARHTHAVYKLDRETGEIIWTLGGSDSDFDMPDDAVFKWQHSAARDTDGTLVLFDNHVREADADESSRGLRLALDEDAMTAEVVTEYTPPQERPAGWMANTQVLDNGDMFIGWGSQPFYSEYTRDGELIYDVCHGDACHGDDIEGGGGSYRAYKAAWEGHPTTDPDVVIEQNEQGDDHVYVSWNGATEVAQWRLVTGDDADAATEATVVDKTSFETAIPLETPAAYVAVEALDADGQVLGTGQPAD
jgi:outer membrane protein assembly factor BamB